MEQFKKEERAYTILEKINFWLGNGDAKVSFILGFTGVFLGFIFASDSITKSIQKYVLNLRHPDDLTGVIISLICLILFLFAIWYISRSVFFLLNALQARIDPKIYSQQGLDTDSVIFWGTITNSANYLDYKDKLDSKQDEQYLNDLHSQIYINSILTNKKFSCYNTGIGELKIGLVFFVIFKLITYFPI